MGVSVRNTAFSCRCSTATVRAVTTRAKAHGLEWPLPEEMNDAAIRAVIYPAKERSDMSKAEIDHPRIDKEMNRPGMTMLTLWREYCEDALASGMEPYLYSAFCQKHRAWAAANKVSMRIERKPAQEMQVDYVGDTMEVLDADTGEARKVYVFVACLPYSGEMFAEGAYNMRAESWVEAHVHAFAFFGGSVPKNFFPSVEKGLRNAVQKGVLAGYPLVGLKAVLYDGSYHPVDSNDMAFQTAARLAYQDGIPKAKPTILEPIGLLKVTIPDANLGDIMSDISSKRRGTVLGMTAEDGMQTVEAEVPMAEMGSYTIDLRSMTQGRGSFSCKFIRYEEAPGNVQQKVIEEAKKEQEA